MIAEITHREITHSSTTRHEQNNMHWGMEIVPKISNGMQLVLTCKLASQMAAINHMPEGTVLIIIDNDTGREISPRWFP